LAALVKLSTWVKQPKRALQCCLFARIFASTVLLLAAGVSHALDVQFKPVAPNVYAYIGETEGRTYDNEALNANFGLVVTPHGALLVDSGASWQGAKKLAEAAKKVTSQPIRWVINTGGQDHRWMGNGYFLSQGTTIYAHANAQADMQARGPEHLRANASVLKERLEGTSVSLPNQWVNAADTALNLGGTQVVLVHRQGGHTPGDTMVWLPHTGVVFSGDVVYVDRILGMHAVSRSKTWLDSFDALVRLEPAVVVPGHGQVSNLAKAQRDTGDLLKAMRQHMGRAVEEGADLSTAVKTFDVKPFGHLQHVDVWLPQLLNRTYLEMELE
jgi:glyoxylase-like metal-dependent hydrolase (beta-lactamase superfamily II)